MNIPRYWAEGRERRTIKGKQVTMRRFGWSNVSQQEAQAHADARTREALEQVESGAKNLDRRERKSPYNGADGFPIREEIIAEHSDAVITRNSYGALCLNTPNVLFADLDFDEKKFKMPNDQYIHILTSGAIVCYLSSSCLIGMAWILFLYMGVSFYLERRHRISEAKKGNPEVQAFARIDSFIASNPDWHFRLYRTPAGLRLLAMHELFSPDSKELQHQFEVLRTDSQYISMCICQQCFRARLTPKPWRMKMTRRMKPRPGVWPVAENKLAERTKWILEYNKKAEGFAACRFLKALGNTSKVHPTAKAIMELHDDLCKAHSGLPIA